ncbi:MAG: hypothetical protein QM778_24395 [Myxococcales bacterium]
MGRHQPGAHAGVEQAAQGEPEGGPALALGEIEQGDQHAEGAQVLAAKEHTEAGPGERGELAAVECVEGPDHREHRQGARVELVGRHVTEVRIEEPGGRCEGNPAHPHAARRDAREGPHRKGRTGRLRHQEHEHLRGVGQRAQEAS